MNRLTTSWRIVQRFGPRIIWLRALIYLQKALGASRRHFAPRPWETIDLAQVLQPGIPGDPAAYQAFKRKQNLPFLFALGDPPQIPEGLTSVSGGRSPALAERLALLQTDRCVYFFRTPSPAPVDWNTNPLEGKHSHPEKIWCDIPDFLPHQGDLRLMWEPARAAWAIDLARAAARGAQIDASGLYWRWVESWMQACPPWTGPQWKCGQESSVRLTALMLGFWAFANSPATTPARWTAMARLAWATGYRVADHIGYAVSQKNNHALSEALGLMLIATTFPEFRDAGRWDNLGRKVMADELRRQIYADGSYVQHSMNYQRVMLNVATLALRLGELTGRPLDRDLYDRIGKSCELLLELTDPETGQAPNYGNNDGAHVLPLTECDFTDFRPTLQSVHYLVHRHRLLPPGPWDEELLWLFGAQALDTPPESPPARRSRAFDDGGYYTLRARESWGMLRCHTYRDRPAQCDPLHLDLWWRGQNVLCDAGTYHYYTPESPAIERYFKSISAHNTVELDDTDPVEFVSRFLFLPWPVGRLRQFGRTADGLLRFEGEHSTYDRRPWRVLHRRTVLVDEAADLWIVVDDLLGAGVHRATVRWHLLDAPVSLNAAANELQLHTPSGVWAGAVSAVPSRLDLSVVRGLDVPGRVQGWIAPYYGVRTPIPVAEGRLEFQSAARIVSAFAPEAVSVERDEPSSSGLSTLRVRTPAGAWQLELTSADRGADGVLRRALRLEEVALA